MLLHDRWCVNYLYEGKCKKITDRGVAKNLKFTKQVVLQCAAISE